MSEEPTDDARRYPPPLMTGGADEAGRAQAQVATFFASAPIGISWREVDAAGRPGANHVNHRFCEIIGMPREEALDIRNVMRATHPDDRVRQEALTKEVYEGKRDRFTLEKRYVHPDGRVVWASLTVAVLRGAEGRVTHHFAMLEDIRARKAAEEELRASERRWRNYLHISSEILYALTPALSFKFLSRAWTAKLGHPVEASLGRSFFEFVHPDDAEACRHFIEAVIAGQPPAGSVEYRAKHIDGGWRWHASAGSPYTDRDGHVSFFGVGRDITRRRRAQDELEAALDRREELERIIDRSPAVVVLFRFEHGSWPTEFVSKSIEQFGYAVDRFIRGELTFIDIVDPVDRERVGSEIEAHESAGHNEYWQNYRVRCADGSIRWMNDHTIVRRAADGRATHHESVLTDVTEQKIAEQLAKAATERDLRVASEVQRYLMPSKFPSMGGCEVEGFAQASGKLGGDYFDVIDLGDGCYGLAIADVSGKGAPAALMMSACRASLRLIAPGRTSPLQVLRALNAALAPDMPPGMFITLFYAVFDPQTRRLTYCRAGHEPAILLPAGAAESILLHTDGMGLGIGGRSLFDTALEEQTRQLHPGDLLALYTDGVNEALNAENEEFGRARIVEVLRRYADQPLAHIRSRLDRHLRRFSALEKSPDDRTFLLMRVR